MFMDLCLVLEPSVVRISDQKESRNALENVKTSVWERQRDEDCSW